MADGMSNRGIDTVNKFFKGINTDVNPIDQPPGTYRLALNMMLESREGDYTSIINEEGNINTDLIGSNMIIIGSVFADNNTVILFSVDKDLIASEIGVMDKDGNYTQLIISSCLNFNATNPIQGVFRVRNGCERVVYFTDDLNPLRSINLDNLTQYTIGGVTPAVANATDAWDCGKFKNNLDYAIADITSARINDGGGFLKVGSYFFAVRYLDEDNNPTNWQYISQGVSVGEGVTSDVDKYSGGVLDLVSVDTFNEGKSITITIENMDTSFPQYQVGIIELTRATGFEPNVFLSNSVDLQSTTEQYTYTGDPVLKVAYTLDELTIPSVVLNRVKTLAQIDSRLVVGNINEDVRDWSEFQQAASSIFMTWNVRPCELDLLNEDASISLFTGPKGGDHSLEDRGYMRDEIYAFGIVYVFNDGTESPVFHIPGRPKDYAIGLDGTGGPLTTTIYTNADLITQGNINSHYRNQVPVNEGWDSQLLTVKTVVADPTTEIDIRNVGHIPSNEFTTGDGSEDSTIERWKVFNTAVETTQILGTEIPQYGIFSYYEGLNTYPSIENCQGNDIWGNDIEGNPLVGEKIRHHKMPDTTLVKIREIDNDITTFDTRSGQIYNITTLAHNVSYPTSYASDIQGYYIVRQSKNQTNSTVIDKGIVAPSYSVEDLEDSPVSPVRTWDYTLERVVLAPSAENFKTVSFWSPKSLFKPEETFSGRYFKFERVITAPWQIPILHAIGVTSYNTLNDVDYCLRPIDGYVYLDSSEYNYVDDVTPSHVFTYQPPINNFPEGILNLFITTHLVAFHLKDEMESFNPNNDLYNYATLKVWLYPHENLFNQDYIRTHNSLFTNTGFNSYEFITTGGNCYITEPTWKIRLNGNITPGVDSNVFLDFFMESNLNTDLRMTGEEGWQTTAYKLGAPNAQGIIDFLKLDTDYNDGPLNTFAPNYYEINSDYSKQQDYNRYFSLPRVYDYCSECEQDFPNRIWFSERSYQEEVDDKYKIFLANSYRDLYGEDSEIFKLFTHNEELYALTPYTTWFVPTRPQQLTTNEGNIYVGTGDVLSVPPKRLQTSDIGYAGSTHPFAVTSTENGVTFVDSNAGKIFLLKGMQLQEISATGMRGWLRENLPLTLTDQFTDFNNLEPAHPMGIGYISTYDPMHNRIIITKKDYRLLFDIEDILVSDTYETISSPYLYGYNTTTGWFYKGTAEDPFLGFTINDDWEDLSWTLTYSFNNQCWESYHSYRPNWLWNNRNKFYSSRSRLVNETLDGKIWEHGHRNFGEFYEQICPSILDITFNNNPINTKVTNSFQIVSYAQEYSNGYFVDVPFETFSNAFVYNRDQSSGLLDVEVKNTQANPFVETFNDFDTIYISNNENTWSFSEFHDMTIDTAEPIFTDDWNDTDYRFSRFNYGLINYPNSNRVDLTKNQFDMQPFRDKWVGTRLWYDNTPVYKYVTQFGHSKTNISFK